MNTRIALIVCATLVIVGLVLTGLANGLGNANEPTSLNDAWLTTKTKIALFTDARVMGREINVESAQGLVMIRGNVSSDETKQTVEGIANGINGVKSVKNDLQVVRPSQREVINDKHEAGIIRDQNEPCQDRSD
ncbi:MAG: BON domain-containing protein [Nitrospira sp.]|nr:BON domain-containing protein [Nitrospira sp.]